MGFNFIAKQKIGGQLKDTIRVTEDTFYKFVEDHGMDVDECWHEINNGGTIKIEEYLYSAKRPFYGICFRTQSSDTIEIIENYDANYLINELHCETVTIMQDIAQHIVAIYQSAGRGDNREVKMISILDQ